MQTLTEPLSRLAAAAGISGGYWDGLGAWRGLSGQTAHGLLAALGHPVDGDPDATARAIEDAGWAIPLPPVVVLRPGGPAGVVLCLPAGADDMTVRWEIRLERDGRLAGEFACVALAPEGGREIGGQCVRRFRMPLPQDLPHGYHQLVVAAARVGAAPVTGETALIVAPARCHVPEALAGGGRCWGLAVQLYSLRSNGNWGIGDFSDLARLARAAGEAGAAFIGLNPVHARHLARPGDASPYAPSSRLFVDPMYIDVMAVPEFRDCAMAHAMTGSDAFRSALAAARDAALVDYAAVAALKLPVLECLYDAFRAGAATDRVRAYEAWRDERGEALQRFAEFESLRFERRSAGGTLPGWPDWPPEWRSPGSDALARYRVEAAGRIGFQCWLHWEADRQLAAAADAARDAGMRLGLYRDLAVGAARDGAETWGDPGLIAQGASVGAPPDLLNRQGQDWGLPPWNPRTLAARAYRPFADLISANMRSAGALRIDHVMALTRLFWIPEGLDGTDGGYVANDLDALAAVVALESERHRCMVVGEDLGSVPDGLRDRLRDLGLLSYRVLIFERHWDGDGRFKHPDEYPHQALATAATHDMPTLEEYWRGEDIGRRDALGLFPEPALRDAETARRQVERERLLDLLAALGLRPADPSVPGAVAKALHGAVARTKSMLAVVQVDDLVGETTPVNIPGTHLEYPNWRRKLSTTVEDIVADPRLARLAAVMREAGRA